MPAVSQFGTSALFRRSRLAGSKGDIGAAAPARRQARTHRTLPQSRIDIHMNCGKPARVAPGGRPARAGVEPASTDYRRDARAEPRAGSGAHMLLTRRSRYGAGTERA